MASTQHKCIYVGIMIRSNGAASNNTGHAESCRLADGYSELAGERRSFLLLGDAQGDQQDWVELKHKTLLNRQQSMLIERCIRQRTPSQRKNLPPSPRTSALPWPGMGRLAFCPSKCTYTTLSIRQTDLAERGQLRGVVDMLDACRIAEWRERGSIKLGQPARCQRLKLAASELDHSNSAPTDRDNA